MIISHKHQFIFIKTFKTAGTSIEMYLAQFCGPDDILTPVNPAAGEHEPRNGDGYEQHMTAEQVRARVGSDTWAEYLTFCVERNPWDKTVSHFFHDRAHHGGPDTFGEYIRRGHFPHNMQFYTNGTGAPIVDEVLRYETINADLTRVFKSLGIPFAGALNVWALSLSREDKGHYSRFYPPEHRGVIEGAFGREIRMHGYTFDE